MSHQDPVSYLMQALRIWEQRLGPDHPDVANSLYNLATLYQRQGKYAEAESLLQRALRIREQRLGPDHPLTQMTRKNYALLQMMGRVAQRRGWKKIFGLFSR